MLLLAFSYLTVQRVHGQFVITGYPPAYEFTFDDLWHFSVNGPSNSNFVEFYVALRVYNDQTDLLVKSNSATFTLPTGNLYINKNNLFTISPLNTLYYQNLYQLVVASGDYFPAGNYHVYLNLMGRPDDGEFSELSEAYFEASVQLLMPPQLIFPEHMDTIDHPLPVLSWLPAFQSTAGQPIQYTLRLVEMYQGQTVHQALSANPAYFEQSEIPITIQNYPVGANPIQLDHTYAWQVAATIGGLPVGYSEMWQFTYALPPVVIDTIIYTRQFYSFFEEKNTGIAIIQTPYIPIRVRENYFNEDGLLSFKIFNTSNQLIASSNNLHVQLMNGVHFIEIPLCGSAVQLDYDKIYLIEISNAKNQLRYLRIKNKFNINDCDE